MRLKYFRHFAMAVALLFAVTATSAGTMECAQSYIDSAAAFTLATDARHAESYAALRDGKPIPPASRNTRGFWVNLLKLSLIQVNVCEESSDRRIRADGYSTAASASLSLKYFADARKYAESCVEYDMLNSICYLTLSWAALDMGDVRKANEAKDEGLRVANVVKDRGTATVFDLNQRLLNVGSISEQQQLTNALKVLRADIKNADTLIRALTQLGKMNAE